MKKPFWGQSLRFFAVQWTVLPLALMLILSIGATTVALQSIVASLAEDRSVSQAVLTAERLAEHLDGYALSLRVLAQQPALTAQDVEKAEAVFKAYDYLLTDFVNDGGLVALNAEGQVSMTYPPKPELLGKDYANQPYFQTLRAANSPLPAFFDTVTEPPTGRRIYGVAAPLIDSTGKFNGILTGRFYPDGQHWGLYLRTLQTQEKSEIILVDRAGVAIFHSDPQLIGKNYSTHPAVMALRESGQAGAQIIEPDQSARQVAGYAPVGATGWGLIIARPWALVNQPLRAPLLLVSVVLILGLLGLILVVLWVARRVTQPLDRLVGQARRVALGDYTSHVEPSRILEIKELGIAFNHMVDQISRYRAGLQEYVASVTNSQEEERKRIARDLHDGTIQTLIAIGQRIELTRDMLAEQSLEQSRERLTELRGMVKEAVAGVRQFSRNLRPLALEDLGLMPSLQYLINQLEQDTAIEAHLHFEGEATGLSQDLEVAIFRITQEALNNIRKHAQATQVGVVVKFLPRQTVLEVRDNGVGFNVPETTSDLARNGSFGLMGLEERANLFGGDIAIQSALNQGTLIRVVLPHKQLPRRRESG